MWRIGRRLSLSLAHILAVLLGKLTTGLTRIYVNLDWRSPKGGFGAFPWFDGSRAKKSRLGLEANPFLACSLCYAYVLVDKCELAVNNKDKFSIALSLVNNS
jgi:hypothetical protein